MKIGIVTFHQALNYGAILQTYALQTFINKSFPGVSAEVVDYRCPYFEKLYSLRAQISKNPVKSALKAYVFLNRQKQFRNFIAKNIKTSTESYSADTVSTANECYDRFIVGSDQVWNPRLSDSDMRYVLDFAEPEKRFSYAASVGATEQDQRILQDYIDQISAFSRISVRERSAADTLRQLGITKPVEVHVDPTLLLDSVSWNQMASPRKACSKKYVLVFEVPASRELIQKAKIYAREKGCEVIFVGPFCNEPGIRYIPCPSVGRLLSLFRDAERVFTNSFHGTVLALQFHKPFYSFMPGSKGSNSRIVDLLEELRLQKRMEETAIDETVDWQAVENALALQRDRARSYLKGIVEHEN